MSLFKRGNVWWFKFMHRGQVHVGTTSTTNRNEAKEKEHDAKANAYKGVSVNRRAVPTLREFEQRFLTEITARRSEHPKTVTFYKTKYASLLTFERLADAPLDRIGHELISQFTVWYLNKPRERATVNRALGTLRRALRLAAKWRIIQSAPQIEMLSDETQRTFVLNREQEQKYLAGAPIHLANFAALSLQTGCRESELIELQWDDIKWEPVGKAKLGQIHVRGTKSKNSNRFLPLTSKARKVLMSQQGCSKCKYVFVRSQDATSPASADTLISAHADVREKLKMSDEFVLHSLRHTFATRLGEAGADAFTIMRIMGHSSITISQRYVHPTAGQVEQAFTSFEGLG